MFTVFIFVKPVSEVPNSKVKTQRILADSKIKVLKFMLISFTSHDSDLTRTFLTLT